MVYQMVGDPRFSRAPPEVNQDEIQFKLNTKESQWDFLARLDYFLPKLESPLCTSVFLCNLYEGTIYAPKQMQMHPVQRMDIPPNEEIRQALLIAIENNLSHDEFGEKLHQLHRHLQSAMGDKGYMLAMLRHLDEDHRYFKKSFKGKERKKPVKNTADRQKQELM